MLQKSNYSALPLKKLEKEEKIMKNVSRREQTKIKMDINKVQNE